MKSHSKIFKSTYGNMKGHSSFFGKNPLNATTIERKELMHSKFAIQFHPKDYIRFGMVERDVELYKEVFDMFDVNGIGFLTPNDLRSALEMFGYKPKKLIIYQIIS